MEEEEILGGKVSKRMSDKDGEVDLKTKAGTAWSHNFLNQKPWHPLSYPNQRRKWIAEQTHAQRQRRAQDIAREYAQEQEFLRQTSILSDKEKEKVDIMQAVSFMYVRPPGYNAESAKAAEIAEERRNQVGASSSSVLQEAPLKEEKKKARPKDVYGRTLPTEEEFAVLKNAPRLETGVAGRAKPFAVEVRNVKCVRCGTFGHQSGDRECPLKDAIMPNDESRLKRDDPLTSIMAQMDPSEPLKWELKQKPGISPPRGGFRPDDPNQQIVAEDIFDEYGGFLSGGIVPELLTNFNTARQKKKSKSKTSNGDASLKKGQEGKSSTSNSENDRRSSKLKSEHKGKKRKSASHSRSHKGTNGSASDGEKDLKMKVKSSSKHQKHALCLDRDQAKDSTSDDYKYRRRSRNNNPPNKKRKERDLSDHSLSELEDSGVDRYHGKSRYNDSHRSRHKDPLKLKVMYEDSSSDGETKNRKLETPRNKTTRQINLESSSSEHSEYERRLRKHKHSNSSKVINSDSHHRRFHHR